MLALAATLLTLHEAIGPTLAAGNPLVVHAHVPLCDSTILRCGRGRLGDGDDLGGNLYWATSGGWLGWFGRRGSGWTEVRAHAEDVPDGVVDVKVWRRRVPAAGAWRRFTTHDVEVYVVAWAWRGKAIDAALAAFLRDAYGGPERRIILDDGTPLAPASVVSWVGHNRLMDLKPIDWAAWTARADSKTRGIIAIACHTYSYMAEMASESRVPLVFTKDYLFAGAHSFEGAVTAFARGGDLAAIRRGAIEAYALGQGKPAARIGGAFINPSDKRWR